METLPQLCAPLVASKAEHLSLQSSTKWVSVHVWKGTTKKKKWHRNSTKNLHANYISYINSNVGLLSVNMCDFKKLLFYQEPSICYSHIKSVLFPKDFNAGPFYSHIYSAIIEHLLRERSVIICYRLHRGVSNSQPQVVFWCLFLFQMRF